jgi:hypothetical protein
MSSQSRNSHAICTRAADSIVELVTRLDRHRLLGKLPADCINILSSAALVSEDAFVSSLITMNLLTETFLSHRCTVCWGFASFPCKETDQRVNAYSTNSLQFRPGSRVVRQPGQAQLLAVLSVAKGDKPELAFGERTQDLSRGP